MGSNITKSDFIAIIPARYGSSRLPGKPLLKIGDKTIIHHVYDRVSSILPQLIVATDDERIMDEVKSFGGNAVMTSPDHPSGTDRVREALELSKSTAKVVINIQGDEPFIPTESIEQLVDLFCHQPDAQIATAAYPLPSDTPLSTLADPNMVKLVRAHTGRALYFSRSIIPNLRDYPQQEWAQQHVFYKHIGLYAYQSDILKKIAKLPTSPLEKLEKLEQLRWLEAGYTIDTVVVSQQSIGIDTMEDWEAAKAYYAGHLDA